MGALFMSNANGWEKLKADPVRLAEHNRKKREKQRAIWAEAAKDPAAIAALRKKNYEAGKKWLANLAATDPVKYAETIERKMEKDRRIKAELRKQPGYYEKANAWARQHRAKNPDAKLAQALRNTINCALRGRYRTGTLIEVLGCTVSQLMRHLEAQWTDGMNWSNYGRGVGKWSVDHIVPCAAFDLGDRDHQHRCFNYTNLRPMWFVDNSSKSSIHNGRKQYHDRPRKSPCNPDKQF